MLWFLPQRFSCNDNDILKSDLYFTKMPAQRQRPWYGLVDKMLFKLFSNSFFKNKIEVIEGTSTSGYIRLNGCAGEATGWSPTSRLLSQHSSVVKDFTYGARLFLEELRTSRGNKAAKLSENMRDARREWCSVRTFLWSLLHLTIWLWITGVCVAHEITPPIWNTFSLHKTKSKVRNSLFSTQILKTMSQNTCCRGNFWIICLMCWMLQQNVGEREQMLSLPPVSKRMHDLYDASNQRTLSQFSLSAPQVPK